MSQLPLCPHCLEPVRSGYHGSCPNCGKSLENHNPEGALPLGTQLGGHYTVGEYQSADGDGLCYRGVDNVYIISFILYYNFNIFASIIKFIWLYR